MVAQVSQVGTALPGSGSQALHERRLRAVSRAVGTVLPVYVEEASGGILRDVDGNQLIDFASGIAVTSVGNSDPRVVARVREQVARFTHTCFMITAYEPYVEVCEQLNELTPGEGEKRSALFNSGAEAVENAIKVARYATGRQAVIAFDHAYHGRTNLAMALTAKAMPYKAGFAPFAGEIYRVPMAYPYRWPSGPERCADEAFEAFVSQVHTQVGEERTAAVILEPIQGEGGFVVPAPGFVARIAQWCSEHGIVFIADEVQTGFCRTGNWFASEFEGVTPDLITTGKAIAGGLPLAGLTGRAELMDAVHAGGLGGTFGGNPVCCAAALGAIETMRAEGLTGRAAALGAVLTRRLTALADKYEVIGDVRGRGLMQAVELVSDRARKTPDPATTAAVTAACHRAGLLTLTCGSYGNVFRFLPPLVISEELLDEGLSIFETALAEVA
jgi:4-aminobutyrate aminotransferase / (S)-3-amino-2-methylpropionate transaminase / 5-aminovalerate transaminase